MADTEPVIDGYEQPAYMIDDIDDAMDQDEGQTNAGYAHIPAEEGQNDDDIDNSTDYTDNTTELPPAPEQYDDDIANSTEFTDDIPEFPPAPEQDSDDIGNSIELTDFKTEDDEENDFVVESVDPNMGYLEPSTIADLNDEDVDGKGYLQPSTIADLNDEDVDGKGYLQPSTIADLNDEDVDGKGYLQPSTIADLNEENGALSDHSTGAHTDYENVGTFSTTKDDSTLEMNEEHLETPRHTPPPEFDPEDPQDDYNDYRDVPPQDEVLYANVNKKGNDEEALRFAGEFESDQDEEFREENTKKFKDKNSDIKCVCLSLLCFISLILAVAFALFVALFLFGSLDEYRQEPTLAPGMTPGTRAPTTIYVPPTLGTPAIELIEVPVTIKLDQAYSPAYDSPSSPEYRELENSTKQIMDDTFNKDMRTSNAYEKTELEGFSPGSINAHLKISFDDAPPITKTPDNADLNEEEIVTLIGNEIQQLVYDIISEAANTGALDGINVTSNSISVNSATVQLAVVTTTVRQTTQPKTTTEPPQCPKFQFPCNDGGCVYTFEECNGVDDCKDGSDEHELCGACKSYQFECANGNCIDEDTVCDGNDDCQDNSDEANCPTTISPQCQPYQFACANGECIYAFEECNGYDDCGDNSDESESCQVSPTTTKSTPTTTEARVSPTTTKVAKTTTEVGGCTEDMFMCPLPEGRKCILQDEMCDGVEDCIGGADEVDCTPQACTPESKFECANGNCIPYNLQCNDDDDCGDNSDETDCAECEPCPDGSNCIYDAWVCDGEADCSDGSDEVDCPVAGPCASNPCLNGGECQLGFFDNYLCLCSDGYMGVNCEMEVVECPPGEFQCTSGQCKPGSAECDGQFDCDDLSDELDCGGTGCRFGEFQCNSGECVSLRQMCDGVVHCADGSDEGDSCDSQGNTCDSQPCLNGGTCEGAKNGYRCICPETYTGRDCEMELDSSINECLSAPCQNGGTCVDNVNSYSCVCQGQYTGVNCEQRLDSSINECLSAPCQNGGTCQDNVNSYSCVCQGQYTGVNCEQQIEVSCAKYEYACANGGCLFPWQECDGVNDCGDGSDEHDLCSACSLLEFQCASRSCIPSYQRCNGVDECGDNSDEDGCPTQPPEGQCLAYEFQCDNGDCIYIFQKCDGTADCSDGSDEVCPCSSNPCLNGATCDHQAGSEYFCTCPPAYTGVNCELVLPSQPPAGQCSEIEIPCDNGDCIYFFEECDGIAQCSDGSDEVVCPCSSNPCLNGATCDKLGSEYVCTCPPTYTGVNCEEALSICGDGDFQCHNGECVDISYQCDGVVDCFDSSDETTCTCADDGFQCLSIDQCVLSSYQCDGAFDCFDDSDEFNCPCQEGQIRCNNTGGFCIWPSYVCDGLDDCRDNSDEAHCTVGWPCQTNPCANGGSCVTNPDDSYFCSCIPGFTGDYCEIADVDECASSPCLNGGTCIEGTNYYICSCAEGFTGTECEIDVGGGDCYPFSEFRCDSGECINFQDRCNQVEDCVDGSDEVNCGCQADQFECKYISECIPSTSQCDGFYDCTDTTDESNCTQGCDAGQFQCASGDCILDIYRCDTYADCGDLSDESNCTQENCNGFACGNGDCVPYSWKCNGEVQCVDGSDEHQCNETCGTYGFRCGHGGCIPALSLCNTVDDCGDNSDEEVCPCEVDSFVCDNGICKSASVQCDGSTDCIDGSDEDERCENPAPCGYLEQSCVFDEGCVAISQVCNGVEDCSSGYDENQSICAYYSCDATEFRCATLGCIDSSKYCNGLFDCFDGSDEPPNCSGDCDPLPQDLQSTCATLLPYSQVHYPFSPAVPKTEAEALSIYNGFLPFSGCHPNALLFMCAYLFPSCRVGNSYQTACRGLCEEVVSSTCGLIITLGGAPTPDCSAFPDTGADICSVPIAETGVCATNPCFNGTCVDTGLDTYLCMCAPGFSGTTCEININECASIPCLNGGLCVDRAGHYTCTCAPGFTGSNCETAIGSCSSSPCQYGGTCEPTANGYTCSCLPGFGGIHCELSRNPCLLIPCMNGATCEILPTDGYSCTCAPGFTGTNCQTALRVCATNPCFNGTCVDTGLDTFLCMCAQGFTGTNCQINIDECVSSPCVNGGVCVDRAGHYTCTCAPGFTGSNCEQQAETGVCASNPCFNGTCVDTGLDTFLCMCAQGFTGTNCQINIDECVSSPCVNGGVCVDRAGHYTCTCAPGFTGSNCEQQAVTGPCATNPCVNGGACAEGTGGSYVCTCAPGFMGANCELDINECDSSPCINGGSCINRINSYICINCTSSLQGDECDTIPEFGVCATNPCFNGTCVDTGMDTYSCTCAPGFTGAYCQINIDECASNPCLNSGVCVDRAGHYTCTCAPGFTGRNCETDINECASSPCRSGSTCTNGVNGYYCSCMPGYTGVHCEMDIGAICSSVPCMNGATCEDSIEGYTCRCIAGFTGTYCETNIDECANQPCLNQGTCADGVNGYFCLCPIGYSGVNCQVGGPVDACSSEPCQNGGTCESTTTGYKCICPSRRVGVNCETEMASCDSNPCMNGATCLEGGTVSGYYCACQTGFMGTRCENPVLDNTPPVISGCPANQVLAATLGNNEAAIAQWDPPSATDDITTDLTVDISNSPGRPFPVGDTIISYIFTDEAGNTATCTFTITVIVDNTPPVINGCPPDQTLPATLGNNEAAIAQWDPPSATDDVTTDLAVDISNSPGRPFPVGDTIISYIFTDEAGNTATCTFTITVIVDTIPPVISGCPADQTLPAAIGGEAAIATWVPPTATDDVTTNLVVNATNSPGRPFPVGDTIIRYFFADDAGNTATCTFTITVTTIAACSSMPCMNGGTCLEGSMVSAFICQCPSGFSGTQCESQGLICDEGHLKCADNSSCIAPDDQCEGYPHCGFSSASTDEYQNAGCSYGCVLYQDYTSIACDAELPYISSFYPNFITKSVTGFDNVVNAATQLRVLYRSRTCDRNVLKLMCGAVFPSCPIAGQSLMAPCRSRCEEIARKPNCVTGFADAGIDLEEMCSKLPEVPVPGEDGICKFY